MDKMVAAWFRGKIEFMGENLERLSKYTSVPKDVQKDLEDAMYKCNSASARLLAEESNS